MSTGSTTPALPPDLTRWNRAGLGRFVYTDGNAANWLELLREKFAERLGEAGHDGAGWEKLAAPTSGTAAELLAYLESNYLTATEDHGWEILRAFARAVHVCTEHLGAYANEGYLRTATQWESLRRLVAMLDYSPAPAASASARVALLFEDGASGTVAAGLQLNDKPDEGSPLTFETLADLEGDSRLNEVRIADWDKSQVLFELKASSAPAGDFPTATSDLELQAGSVAVLRVDGGEELVPLRITSVAAASVSVENNESGAGTESWEHHRLELLARPKVRAAPLLAGDDVAELSEAVPLAVGDLLGRDPGTGKGFDEFALVRAVEGSRVRLKTSPAIGTSRPIRRGKSSTGWAVAEGDALHRLVAVNRGGNTTGVPRSASLNSDFIDSAFDSGTSWPEVYDGEEKYRWLDTSDSSKQYWYVPEPTEAVATVVSAERTALEFEGKPGKLATGDPVVFEMSSGELVAALVGTISETDEGFELTLRPEGSGGTAELKLSETPVAAYWGFQDELRPTDYNVNAAALTGATSLSLELDVEDWPSVLDTTREIVLYDSGQGIAAAFTVSSADTAAGSITLDAEIAQAEDADGVLREFTKHGTVLLGNVVAAGHGEAKKQRVLGSGDSTNSSPEFELEFDDVSFVADSTMPNGVRADVAVTIGGRTWEQVGSIRDSAATDMHYDVRPLDSGGLRFRFSRRLPTGSNNVLVSVRRGSGSAGNLARGSLVKLKKPHSLVGGVIQPADAAGGSDLEPVSSLRENAPESVLTLERAVSMSDFGALAASHASVWQAQALPVRVDRAARFRGEGVRVVVVPSGGGSLTDLLKDDLTAMLTAKAMPGVVVSVEGYTPLVFDLDIRVRIDVDAYDEDEVKLAVRSALENAFSVEQRPLAAGLYRSQVYTVVEAVEGVSDSVCRIVNPMGDPLPAGRVSVSGGVIRSLRARDGELLSVGEIAIEHTEYSA